MKKVPKLLLCLLPLENKMMRAFAGGFHTITHNSWHQILLVKIIKYHNAKETHKGTTFYTDN